MMMIIIIIIMTMTDRFALTVTYLPDDAAVVSSWRH
jgi:hypothetical protein